MTRLVRQRTITCAFMAGLTFWMATPSFSDVQHVDSGWSSRAIQLPVDESESIPIATALALNPAGTTLAVAGDDQTIHLWDLTSRRFIATLTDHQDWIRSLAYSPSGRLLASAGNDRQIILWDTVTKQRAVEPIRFEAAIASVAFDPGGDRLAAIGFGNRLFLIDVATGATIRELICPCVDMRALAWSPDGSTLIAAGRSGIIRVWDAVTGRVIRETPAHRQRVRAVAFAPSGDYSASGSEDRTVRVARAATDDVFFLATPTAKVMALSFCGPGLLACGGSDNAIQIWDLGRRRETARLTGHSGSILALVSDGKSLVSASYDATIRIWTRDGNVAAGAGSGNRVGALPELQLE